MQRHANAHTLTYTARFLYLAKQVSLNAAMLWLLLDGVTPTGTTMQWRSRRESLKLLHNYPRFSVTIVLLHYVEWMQPVIRTLMCAKVCSYYTTVVLQCCPETIIPIYWYNSLRCCHYISIAFCYSFTAFQIEMNLIHVTPQCSRITVSVQEGGVRQHNTIAVYMQYEWTLSTEVLPKLEVKQCI